MIVIIIAIVILITTIIKIFCRLLQRAHLFKSFLHQVIWKIFGWFLAWHDDGIKDVDMIMKSPLNMAWKYGERAARTSRWAGTNVIPGRSLHLLELVWSYQDESEFVHSVAVVGLFTTLRELFRIQETICHPRKKPGFVNNKKWFYIDIPCSLSGCFIGVFALTWITKYL